MTKKLLIISALAGALTLQAAPGGSRFGSPRSHRQAKAPATHLVWLPGSIQTYYYADMDGTGNWELGSDDKYTYSENGLVLESVSSTGGKVTYEYDEYGKLTVVTSYYGNEGDYTPSSRTSFKYDNVVKNYRIEEDVEDYIDGTWTMTSGSRRIIERNDKGNVTAIRAANFQNWDGNGTWTDNYEVTVTYGADGKASDILVKYIYPGDEPSIDQHLTDIVWENTNGQLLPEDGEYFSDEDLFVGANRIKSATMANLEDTEEKAYVVATYTGTNGDYKYITTFNGKTVADCTHTKLDNFGSYYESSYEVDLDQSDDGTTVVEDGWCKTVTKVRYDSNRLLLLHRYDDEYDDNTTEYQETLGTVTTDPTHGYPTEYVVQSSASYSPEYRYTDRQVFGDYKQFTGIDNVTENDGSLESMPAEFYNIQGVKLNIENAAPGLYIKRQGNKATKVLVR